MSVNTSTSSNSSINSLFHTCSKARVSIHAFISIKSFVVLPLSILVLYLGHQRWWQQRSSATTSHSDIFTYHLAAMELMAAFGSYIYICGTFTDLQDMIQVGVCLSSISGSGETWFHILTCVERYLAVVHPITYLRLKNTGGVRIRNISIVCVWLLCFVWIGVSALLFYDLTFIPLSCLSIFSLIVVSFCSLSVLCVLIRPGPGEGGGNRKWVDQSKQKAFHTVMAIMGVLWLWFVACLVSFALSISPLLSYSDRCLVLMSGSWFSLPSSLVLPLLFLHRAGKLKFSSSNTD